MNTHATFTTKAEKYARYRWDYAPEAIEAICATAGLSSASVVADIGAGTGILTRHFAGRVSRVVAIEPNAAMRREAEQRLPVGEDCAVLPGSAEQIPLPDHSVDLITAATAIMWFVPQPTRREFLRVLKPGGWLAVLRNIGTDAEVGQAVAAICTTEFGANPAAASPPQYQIPVRDYFDSLGCQTLTFPFSFQEDWEQFFGALCSTSYMPDEDHPAYPRLARAAREIFDRFSAGGWLTVHGKTEVTIGPVRSTPFDEEI